MIAFESSVQAVLSKAKAAGADLFAVVAFQSALCFKY